MDNFVLAWETLVKKISLILASRVCKNEKAIESKELSNGVSFKKYWLEIVLKLHFFLNAIKFNTVLKKKNQQMSS